MSNDKKNHLRGIDGGVTPDKVVKQAARDKWIGRIGLKGPLAALTLAFGIAGAGHDNGPSAYSVVRTVSGEAAPQVASPKPEQEQTPVYNNLKVVYFPDTNDNMQAPNPHEDIDHFIKRVAPQDTTLGPVAYGQVKQDVLSQTANGQLLPGHETAVPVVDGPSSQAIVVETMPSK